MNLSELLAIDGLTDMKLQKLKADLKDHRSLVQFRNLDQPCMIITADKAKQDAQNFREAASLLPSSPRADRVKAWLNELAGKYDQLDGHGEG